MPNSVRRMLTSAAVVLTATSAVLPGAGGPAAEAVPAAGDGRVFIVQALPGDEVSVTVDGGEPTTGVATKDIIGPLGSRPARTTCRCRARATTTGCSRRRSRSRADAPPTWWCTDPPRRKARRS